MSSKKKLGWFLLSSASLAAMGALTPAVAQEADDVNDEIVVTATGRSAAIQDVPIAVQAISGETLDQAGVENLLDLNQVTPTLRIGSGQSTTSGTIASIRGIGTGADNPGFESAVGFFIDGVYRARAGAALADLPELERIEVLRGPQGTLFGKNTSSGAISVITAGPEHDFGVWGEIGAGDRNELHTAVGMTGALSDSFALRLDARQRAQDGFINDVTSGRDVNSQIGWSLRGQALWDITSDASFRLIADYSIQDQNCCGAIVAQRGTVIGALADTYFPGRLLNPATNAPLRERNMTLSPNRSYNEYAEDSGISGELNWDLGGVNLTSVSAWRDWQATRDQDIDFSSIDRAYRDDLEVGFTNMSQEIRLQGESGNVNWLVGAFFSREELETTDRIRFGTDALAFGNAAYTFLTQSLSPGGLRAYATQTPGSAATCFLVPFGGTCLPDLAAGMGQVADNWSVETTSASLFTHNEISLSENLIWTIGLRYSMETKDLEANLNSVNPACDSLRGANRVPALTAAAVSSASNTLFALACNAVTNTLANGTHTGNRDENEFSGTTSLAYHINDGTMIYGGYSRGYKAGGFNVDRSAFFGPGNLTPTALILPGTDAIDFEPEFTDAYELGLKTDIFGGMGTLNITGFYQVISDYQNNVFSGFNFFTQNVEEVTSEGVEMEMLLRPTDALTFTGGVLYNQAEYNSDTTFGTETIFAGTRLTQNPDFTVTASINYEQPLYWGMVGNLYINGRYVTDYTTQTLGRAQTGVTDNNEFALFDARFGIGPEDGRWSADIFVRNLTDEFYNVGGFGAPERTLPSALDPTTAGSNYLVYPNEPRTIGVTLRARY
jgi:outer membrane receptor protein involved in Fe transport